MNLVESFGCNLLLSGINIVLKNCHWRSISITIAAFKKRQAVDKRRVVRDLRCDVQVHP